MRKPSMFDGDGRKRVDPPFEPAGTMSEHVTRAQARLIIREFEKTGISRHSARGTTAWVVIMHCAEQYGGCDLVSHYIVTDERNGRPHRAALSVRRSS